MNIDSSAPFIKGLKAMLGDDIKHPVLKEFMGHLNNGVATPPMWEIDSGLTADKAGYYHDGKIHLNEQLILKAENDPEAS